MRGRLIAQLNAVCPRIRALIYRGEEVRCILIEILPATAEVKVKRRMARGSCVRVWPSAKKGERDRVGQTALWMLAAWRVPSTGSKLTRQHPSYSANPSPVPNPVSPGPRDSRLGCEHCLNEREKERKTDRQTFEVGTMTIILLNPGLIWTLTPFQTLAISDCLMVSRRNRSARHSKSVRHCCVDAVCK